MKILIKKIITISAIVMFLLIALLSSYSTFFANNIEELNSFIYSPVYFIPWLILLLLIIIYPWLINENKKLISFITIHLPLLILICMIIISFITNKSYIFKIKEGERLNIKDIALNAGVIYKKDTFIDLVEFSIERYKTKKKEIKNYISIIKINSEKKLIQTNKPLKLNNISIYQKSFSLAAKEIIFSFEGQIYDIFDQEKGIIKTNDGYYFEIYAKDIIGNNIIYEWKIVDGEFEPLFEGAYLDTDSDSKKYLEEYYNFYFVKQDFIKISVLELTYKPAKFYLFLASILFLLSILYKIWGLKFIKNMVKK